MQTKARHRRLIHPVPSTSMLFVAAAVATILAGRAAHGQAHMAEAVRTSIDKLVVIGGTSPAEQQITGTYEKPTPGLIGGMDSGSQAGTMSKDVGGVPVNVPVPILTLPGAIIGGITGMSERDIQEFRGKLTEDLADAADKPLSNSALASDVYFGLQSVPHLDTKIFAASTPVPDETDAVLT